MQRESPLWSRDVADVQPDRHFLRLHRDILTALCAVQISNTALRVALAVVRASYGFNEPTTGKRLHIDALLGLTGVRSASQVRRALRELEDCGIIEAVMRPVVGSRMPVEYGLVKDWESWARLPARWSMPWREGGDPELYGSPNSTVPRTPEYLDPELLSTSTPNSRVPLDRRDEKRDEKRSSAARAGERDALYAQLPRRGPDPSLRSSTTWETVGAATDAASPEDVAVAIWRRTLSIGDDLALRTRLGSKRIEDYRPPQGQLDGIARLVLANDAATIEAAVQRASGGDHPRALLLSMADATGKIVVRPTVKSQPEQREGSAPSHRRLDPERWWEVNDGVRAAVDALVTLGRVGRDLDSVMACIEEQAREHGVDLPSSDLRPTVDAWIASKRAARAKAVSS